MREWIDHLTKDRRLVILQLLMEAGSSTGESALEVGLKAFGHRRGVTRDTVRGDLRWLGDAGLLTIEWPDDRTMVAIITRRGMDCARGDIEVEGVKMPDLS